MFGLLKSKLSGFIKGLTGREEQKAAQPQASPNEGPVESAEQPETKPVQQHEQVHKPQAQPEKSAQEHRQEPAKPLEAKPVQHRTAQEPAHKIASSPAQAKKEPVQEKREQPQSPPAQQKHAPPEQQKHAPPEQQKQEQPIPSPPVQQTHAPQERQTHSIPPAQPKPSIISSVVSAFSGKKEPPKTEPPRIEPKAYTEQRPMAPKLGLGTQIRSIFSSEVTIGESDVSDLLRELELALLEADVAYDVSLEVSSQLRQKLVGMKVPKGEVEKQTRDAVQRTLESVMDSERKFDFVERVKSLPKPAKILFVGPNGAGKTTTMAKVARLLLDSGLTVLFSASDTFRAAAIEQTEVHAGRLGIKAIKSKYGADPSSVAFDAISFAKSHATDVVLIDSAGRQDTNANLLSELKKINRVASPDIKLYIGESIGGNAVIDQIRAFHEAIGLDGAILTKIDCDAKGGTAISVSKAAGVPVLFLGVGQGYNDLVPFDPHNIAQQIMN